MKRNITTINETWEMTKRDKDRFLVSDMDFWRRSSRGFRMDHKRNETIKETMEVN